jgi:hypothetical protein
MDVCTASPDSFDRLGRMKFLPNSDRVRAVVAAALGISLLGLSLLGLIGLAGCGTPGAPQPPSLKLPEQVTGLTAVRAGNSVTLLWKMPRKTTDHLPIKGPVRAKVCRREAAGVCQPAGEVSFLAEAEAQFQETLPAALATGKPRRLDYFVELMSQKGRSAGLSNAAPVLAGTAPQAITGLSAEVRADGVALHWDGSESGSVRLHRKLLTPPAPEKKSAKGSMQPEAEPVLRDLFVETPAAGAKAGALDHTVHFGESYEYTVQRVDRVAIDGTTLELAGEISAPIRVEVVDTFPPAVPRDLVAVLVPEEKTIDLSWQPDTDEDLAGYIVYRAESEGGWRRISAAQPLTGPAYRDATVEPGHSYRYAVSAIDLTGHESKRSSEAQESVPNP